MSISGSLRSRLGMLPACHTLTGRRNPWKIQSSPLPEAGQTSAPELLVVGFGDGGGDQGMAGTVRRREAETGPGVLAGGSLRVPIRRRLKRLRAVREVVSRTDRNTHLPAGIPAWLFRHPDGGARAVRRWGARRDPNPSRTLRRAAPRGGGARACGGPRKPGFQPPAGPVGARAARESRGPQPYCISWRFRAGAHG